MQCVVRSGGPHERAAHLRMTEDGRQAQQREQREGGGRAAASRSPLFRPHTARAQRQERRSPYSPTQPEPSDAPAKRNADVEAPALPVQVAAPEPEYPSALQGQSNAAAACREQRGCTGRSRRQQTGAQAARLRIRERSVTLADQITGTAPP